MTSRKKKFKLLLALGATLALLAGAAIAHAESVQKGNLVVTFNGDIAPTKLPRTDPVSVGVTMGAKIKTTDKSTPPELKTINLDINSAGIIDSTGLPLCPLSKLNNVSSNTAEKVCGPSLVGHGNVTSRVSLPGQGAFASNGKLLAFNGKVGGKPAVLAQVASGAPLPLTYVIQFVIKKSKGQFGNSLVATLPPIASSYGYISAFDLSLKRTYTFKGKKRSFVSANCPAPKGFTVASFPFARSSFGFADGRILESTLERSCKVKG
jgi:hypothetical protein